jgi:Holliday junction resolvase-like predicted endonuclease
MQLIQLERITKLGRLGESMVAERLKESGFTDVENLNRKRVNYPFADILATRDDIRYLIGVKTRNEMRQGEVGLNESYNLVLVRNSANAELKRQGKSQQDVTNLLLAEVGELAKQHNALPAWATVAVRPKAGTYSAYFGLVSELGIRRSVPMTPKYIEKYFCLAKDIFDNRITVDLLNS